MGEKLHKKGCVLDYPEVDLDFNGGFATCLRFGVHLFSLISPKAYIGHWVAPYCPKPTEC